MTTEKFFDGAMDAIDKTIREAEIMQAQAKAEGNLHDTIRWCNRAIGMIDARLQVLELWRKHEQEVCRGISNP